jgi:hypothetical protein
VRSLYNKQNSVGVAPYLNNKSGPKGSWLLTAMHAKHKPTGMTLVGSAAR